MEKFIADGNLPQFLTSKPLYWTKFYEKQEGLLCAQHALNNLFQNMYDNFPLLFVNNFDARENSAVMDTDKNIRINLASMCHKFESSENLDFKNYLGAFETPTEFKSTFLDGATGDFFGCISIGDYTNTFLITLLYKLQIIFYVAGRYDKHYYRLNFCDGLILNTNSSHWVAVIKKEKGWIWIDSLENPLSREYFKNNEALQTQIESKNCSEFYYITKNYPEPKKEKFIAILSGM